MLCYHQRFHDRSIPKLDCQMMQQMPSVVVVDVACVVVAAAVEVVDVS